MLLGKGSLLIKHSSVAYLSISLSFSLVVTDSPLSTFTHQYYQTKNSTRPQ
jgi:hypothetical protein